MGVISLDLQQTDAGANKWSYNWLTDLPSINGVTVQGDLTLEELGIIIPTKVSELENDAGYVTSEALENYYTKDETYSKGEVDTLIGAIVIPTKVSELENDAGYITDAALTPYYTSAQVDSLVEAEAAQRLNSDTALGNRLTTAEGKIATNETDIANNAANIAANTAGIATNAANIATNTANIATNTADIATNTSAIATNTANIATNTADIAANTTNIAANTSAISQNTSDIATNTANIATNASAIAQNTSDIAANTADIATNTANIATNTANIATNASDIAGETDAREIADQNLQEQIDAIAASSDVVDIVGTYAALQAYDTSKLHDNDIIKVLDDETRNDATTYYRWAVSTSTWSYIGAEGPFYTKADADATFVPQTRTINSKALSSNITLTAQDVGALPDSTVIPTVNNATLTIQKNGTAVQTFTANSSTNKTANITVPTKTSDLTNDGDGISNFATETYVDTYGGKIDVIKVNGTAQTITNKTVDIPVPTKTSDITNDSGYITSSSLPTKTSDLTNDGSDGTSTYVEADELATVATSGSYNDLSNRPTIPDPKNYYWANVKVSDTSSTSTTPTFARSTYTGTGYPHLQGNGNGLMLAATSGWTAGTGALVLETARLRPSSVESGNMDLGKSDSLWKNLYLSGDIYKGTYKLTLPSKTGTVALTSDIPGVFTGADASTAGTSGIVPAPAAGDNTKFLSGDGTWKTVSQYELPIASANTLGGVKIGENLSITNTGVLSADAQQIDVDSAMSTTSENPVQNKVVTTELNKKANSSSLATVATSGSYNDLSNKPTIPTVNNATLTIQKNGTNVQTFTANSSSNKTANITVPTKTSDLTNDSNFVASGDLATVATSGSYNDLSNKPTIPTVNNATLTIQKNGSTVKTFTANASSNVTANITVPTSTSELTNDAGFIDEIPVASAGTLGGVKVGTNLSINASGVLSADCPVYTANNVAPTADTVDAWITALGGSGVYFTWYTQSGKFTKQPSQYGFLRTIIGGSDIRQEWWTQTGGWHGVRTGNYSGWSSLGGTDGTFVSMGAKLDSSLSTSSANPVQNQVVTNALNNKANSADLATVATSGSYNDLSNKPTIPTVNNATLTIQKNGTNVQTFTANQSTNATANITVPTKVSDLSNTSGGFITYCTCTSAATATTKTATVDSGDSNWVLRKGTIVGVKYTNTNTASATKLNVGGTGDKSVYYNTAVYTGTSTIVWGNANRFVFYMYDGTNWVWISDSRHDGNDNTYTTAYCSTAAGTAAKAATMTGYVLTANRYTVITFTNANSYAGAITLNINGKGAKPLYINGAASSSSNHTLAAGSYIVYYDGTKYHIYNNGEIPRMIHSENPSSVVAPSSTVPGSSINDGSITFAKTATGEFLKLQLSTVDIGEGASLPANTLYGVYE